MRLGWVHNIFACVALQPELNVNACCNARLVKISIPTLRCIATCIQINLYALPVTTRRKQNIVNTALLCLPAAANFYIVVSQDVVTVAVVFETMHVLVKTSIYHLCCLLVPLRHRHICALVWSLGGTSHTIITTTVTLRLHLHNNASAKNEDNAFVFWRHF